MSLQPHGQPVQQILFGLTTKGGLGPKKWSQGLRPDRVQEWDENLKRYNRLNPTALGGYQWVPETAFSYFEFSNGTAVVLARFNTVESGRNTSHALLGSARTLRRHAMSLSGWNGWRPDPDVGVFHSVDQFEWEGLRADWVDAARGSVGHNRHALTKLVGAILERPDEHFAVLNHEDPLPLLTLARDVLDPVLSTANDLFDWTYSTYDNSDTTPAARPDVDGAPRLWCVRSRPDSGEAPRTRVDVVSDVEDSPSTRLAKYLTSLYLEAPSRYADYVNAELAGVNDCYSRVRKLLAEESGKPDVARGGRTIATSSATWQPRSRRVEEKSSSDFRLPSNKISSVPRPEAGHGTSSSGKHKVAGSAMSANTSNSVLAKIKLMRKDGSRSTVDELFNELSDPATPPDRRLVADAMLREFCATGQPGLASMHGTLNELSYRLRVLTGVLAAILVLAVLVILADWLFGSTPEASVPTSPSVTATITVPAERPPGSRPENTAPTGGGAQPRNGG